ncbi:MAG: patatin-like phospholipase family protein [Spirochaetaceae bacterium]|nr:patatin-like phospholipase family protein [Spirochaetaceae bacterium]
MAKFRSNPGPALLLFLLAFSGRVWTQEPALPTIPETAARPRIALVLSGGSAFGMAHVGVIKVLEEAGIPIDMVMGTSMGSIVAGLYAAGYSPAEMEKIVTGIDWNAVFMDSKATAEDRYEYEKRAGYVAQLGFGKSGLAIGEGFFTGQNVLTLFTQLTLHNLVIRDFDDFPVPYRAVAADIANGEKIVFSEGSLAEAMRSSMSIPGVFKPYIVDGRQLVDGGMVDNLPVDLAKEMGADIVIAVESRGSSDKSQESLNNALSIAGQTFNLFIEQNMTSNRQMADLLIKPDLSMYTTMSYGEAAGIIAQGEKCAREALPQIKALAAKIAGSRSLVNPEQEPNRKALCEPPRISSLTLRGGSETEQDFARAEFRELVGSVPSREAVGLAIDRTYATGEFDLVKLDLEPAASGEAELVVSLVPATKPKDALLFNFDMDTIVSSQSSIDPTLSVGLLFRGWTTKNSAMFIKASAGSGIDLYSEYFQPIGSFFAMPWLRFDIGRDSWILDTLKISTLYRTYGGGLWLGLALGSHSDLRIGASLESVKDGSRALVPVNERLLALRSAYHYDNRSSIVFPERGWSLLAYASWANAAIGSEIPFLQAEADFEAALPLGQATTLGIAAFAGTDFAGIIPGAPNVSSSRYFTLARQGMFYGINDTEPQGTGDTLAGIGLEVRHKIGRINPILGGDIYLMANASVGTADWYGDSTVEYLPLRYSGTLGAGLRLSSQMGIFAGAGIVGISNTVQPAFTLMIGSFEDKLEDRR